MSDNTIKVELPDPNSGIRVQMGGETVDSSNTPIVYDGIGWTVRGYDVHNETGLVIFLDVLGMKRIWKRLRPNEVVQRWNGVIRAFMNSLERRPPRGGHLFRVLSDTIIITIPTQLTYSAIREAFDLLLQPFIESLKLRMLSRGTISYGEYHLSERLIIGEALDDAAYHHDKFNWVGISISPSLSGVQDLNAITGNSFTFYRNIPHKETPYNGLVLNWPRFDSDRRCQLTLEQESQGDEDPIKYENTFAFYRGIKN
jgi:hypothetical protein